MTLTLLLDLDNTLLDTNMEAFLPAYYDALANYLSPLVPPAAMLGALRSGVNKMLANDDPGRTLQDVFEADFYPRLSLGGEELRPAITRFYETVFPTLGTNVSQRPGGVELVDWALSAGHQIAIATDPLFPLQASQERVRWAGLDPQRFALISSFETFHFSKTRAAYYAELIGRLGWPDTPVVMAGDDVERDMLPAHELGVTTFLVNGTQRRDAANRDRRSAVPGVQQVGDLSDLKAWLETAQLGSYTPPLKNKAAILAVLAATPGVLHSLVAGLDAEMWGHEPSEQDWAMIELVCHLRDTEREVHALQIKTLLEAKAPFVPRPDAAVWAKQRRYLSENGPAAVQEFTLARVAILKQLNTLEDEVWSKPARHAIFGPTNFLEVVGFMADHDRMHLQQAWRTLESPKTVAHRS